MYRCVLISAFHSWTRTGIQKALRVVPAEISGHRPELYTLHQNRLRHDQHSVFPVIILVVEPLRESSPEISGDHGRRWLCCAM